MSDARTQDYVAGVAPDTAVLLVHVPRVHLAFLYEGRGYIAMEYVAGVTIQQHLQKPNVERSRTYKAVAAAVKQLIEIRVSPDGPPGSVGVGYRALLLQRTRV